MTLGDLNMLKGWEDWRKDIHEGNPSVRPEYTNRLGVWHHDFIQDRPGTDENGNVRRPSQDFGCSLSEPLGGFNKASLLLRGWTRTAISRVLGKPDRTLVRRASLMRAARPDRPECVYSRERVEAAEALGLKRYRNKPAPKFRINKDGDLVDRDGETVDEAVEFPEESMVECPSCLVDFLVHRSTRGRKRKYCSKRCRNKASRKKIQASGAK